MQTIVVVGAGIAGVRTAQRLRERGWTDRIVMIGGEPHLPYDRPPLSKHVLRNERDLPTLLSDDDHTAIDADWRLGIHATGLDTAARTVATDAGDISYDLLIIATGARARRVPGIPGDVMRTWDDAAGLRGRITPGSTLAVIGAGLIGCEVAASAVAMGADVHVIDILDGPMARVVGPPLAQTVTDLHTGRGVTLHLGTTVAATGDGDLELGDGTVLRPDLVLHAVGAIPDTDWLAGSGLDITDGVACDEDGRTSAPGVFAVGDVAAWGGHRAEHWTNAVEQADRVAAVITDQAPMPGGVPYWWSDQYDIRFQGLGSVADADDYRLVHWGPQRRPVALYGHDGRLVAAVGISAPGGVMRLRADIIAGTPLDEVAARFEDTVPA